MKALLRLCHCRYDLAFRLRVTAINFVRWSKRVPLLTGHTFTKDMLLWALPATHEINSSHTPAVAGGRLVAEAVLSFDNDTFALRGVTLVAPYQVFFDLPPYYSRRVGLMSRDYLAENVAFLLVLVAGLLAAGVLLRACWHRQQLPQLALACPPLMHALLCQCAAKVSAAVRDLFKDKMH
jgi:hypothetical protein